MIKWLKNKIRRWLGLGEMFIGVDVGIKDESCVVVVSRLRDGQVRIMDVRFGTIEELKRFVKTTQSRYGISNRGVIVDAPFDVRNYFKNK